MRVVSAALALTLFLGVSATAQPALGQAKHSTTKDPAASGGNAPAPGAHKAAKHPPSPKSEKKGNTNKTKKKAPPSKRGRKGKLPRKAGSEAGAPTPEVRATVAGTNDLPPPVEPPEIAAIREVDRVLFPHSEPAQSPHSLDGMFEYPATVGSGATPHGPRVLSSGLPPAATLPGLPKPAEPVDLAWLKKLERPDIPVRWDTRVVRYLDYYRTTERGRSMISLWIRKSGRFEAAIRKVLREHGMPEDIVWLAMMESGFNPTIQSGAGAAGLWQFTADSGRAYGLRVDKWVDERLDPERSTLAAIRYLQDLHKRFGRWELAFAAYNMGYGGLLRSIRKYNTNDFWELSRIEAGVPYETALYVPKIIAMAVVAHNRTTFRVQGTTLDEPQPFEPVAVGPGVSLERIAEASDSDVSVLRELNPQLLAGRTPPATVENRQATWIVRVPKGASEKIGDALADGSPESRSQERYVVRWGESLSDIASSRGASTARLKRDNALPSGHHVRPGDVLLLPKHKAAKSSGDALVAVVPSLSFRYPGRREVFYRVAPGDGLQGVADALGLTVDELCRWNALDPTAALHSAMMLRAFVPENKALPRVVLHAAKDVKTLTVGTDEFFDYFEKKKGRRRLEIVAKRGDTWKKLSKRFGISLGMLERINHRSRRSPLVVGESVVVYVKESKVPAEYRASARSAQGRAGGTGTAASAP